MFYFASSAYNFVLKELINLNKDETETLRLEGGSYNVSQNLLSISQSNEHESNGILEKYFIEIMSMHCHDNEDTTLKRDEINHKINCKDENDNHNVISVLPKKCCVCVLSDANEITNLFQLKKI